MRSIVVAVGPSNELPWWWEQVKLDRELCDVDFMRINFRGKRGRQISALELPFFLIKVLRLLFALRRKYDYVYTFEADLPGMGIAFWQSLLLIRRPRHVILQFIMREKTERLSSRLKYAFLKFTFGSVYRVICSSRVEADYYRQAFGWDSEKVRFVPIQTSGTFLTSGSGVDGDYLIAAGRTFRDYRTAIAAVKGTPFRLVIVGASGIASEIGADSQVEVIEEIPMQKLTDMIRDSAGVVVPLHDRKISTGQSVVLQGMAMGKLVIATRTAGTVDYIEHMVNGLLVDPGDVAGMRAAIMAAADEKLRRELGQRARHLMATQHLPHHFTAALRKVLV
jgi:glycosyltransferase involved in cell wall biosynthesis